jgi:hypothetical protein
MLQLERNGAPHRVYGLVRSKSLDAADIVREAMLRQQRELVPEPRVEEKVRSPVHSAQGLSICE